MKELIEIQSKLEAPKGQYNSFGKYAYRSAEDILGAVKPLAAEQKSMITLTDDIVMVGNRIYAKATATITNSSGESFSTSGFAREAESKKGMDESQISGSASSYARKYALNGLLAIDDTKDADSNEQQRETASANKNNSNSNYSSNSNQYHSEFGKLAKKIESKNGIDESKVYSIISSEFGLQINKFYDFVKLTEQQKKTIIEFMKRSAV